MTQLVSVNGVKMAWYKMKAALDVGSVQITLEEKWDNERKKMAYRILVTGHKIDADYMHGTVIDIEAQILRKTAEKKNAHISSGFEQRTFIALAIQTAAIVCHTSTPFDVRTSFPFRFTHFAHVFHSQTSAHTHHHRTLMKH